MRYKILEYAYLLIVEKLYEIPHESLKPSIRLFVAGFA
jgi:hypothetical protein